MTMPVLKKILHPRACVTALTLALAGVSGRGAPAEPTAPVDKPHWKNPLVKKGYLNSPRVETTPFVFNDRLYLAENYQAFVDSPSKVAGADAEKDALRIRDVVTGEVVSVALHEHSFGTVFVDSHAGARTVYAFSAMNTRGKPWRTATSVSMAKSADLKTWSEPRTVLQAEGDEQIFNVAVCRGADRYVLLYETNDKKYPPFTFKYCESDDLVTWRRIPGALYGTEKYVGGPALYYEGGWYYTLYLEALPNTEYQTRVTRSRDLRHWQDAPPGRPFLTFDRTKKSLPLRPPELHEANASDPELCYFRGRTIVYFTGSDQQVAGDLQRAEFDGTPRELFERFFEGVREPPAR